MTSRKVITGNAISFQPISASKPSEQLVTMKKLLKSNHQHLYQLNQLDLNLETTPRDSRYSNHLLELMKKEESASKDPHSSATKALFQKVDDSLRAETRSFFNKLVHQNLKKYHLLQEKFSKERDHLKQELLKELQQSVDSSVTYQDLCPPPSSSSQLISRPFSPNHVYTYEDIEREEERLNADYFQHWFEYESLHLDEAFRLQAAKIDNDWFQHEIQLKSEFDAKKAPFLSKGSTETAKDSSTSLAATAPQPSRWHSAEKQKTLIHTAPVFTPNTQQLSRPASGNHRNRSSKDSHALASALEVRQTLLVLYLLVSDHRR